MEANAAGQDVAQAVEDGFYRRLLDQRSGHIEQGSIPAIGGRQASVVFRHAHQTNTTTTDLPYRVTLTQSVFEKPPLVSSLWSCAVASQLPKSPGTMPECGQPSLGVKRPLEVV